MKRVIIFGTGKLSKVLEDSLNEKVEILAYADNNVEKWGRKISGKFVIDPKKIPNYTYDYILIGSQFNDEILSQLLTIGIEDNTIFEFIKFIDYGWDYVRYSIDRVIEKKDCVETLVTGISYTYSGFDERIYKNPSCKLANVSQDLFYDYHLVKFLLENNDLKKLNEVIIGLSYYSFEYDLSLSAMKSKEALYYRNINIVHHGFSLEDISKSIEKNDYISKEIFKFNENNKVLLKWEACVNKYVINEKIGKWQAETDCNKNYPNTIKENEEILREYLKLLKNRGIKPIIVVFPTSQYYHKNFSRRIEEKFKSIINKLEKEFEFQYIDYFRSYEFSDIDFKDVSHLSQSGAEKFTEKLNSLIK